MMNRIVDHFFCAWTSIAAMCFLCFPSFSQDRTGDSLKLEVGRSGSDTARCRLINAYIEHETRDEEWKPYNDRLFGITKKKLDEGDSTAKEYKIFLRYHANSLNNFGLLATHQGKNYDAKKYFRQCADIYIKLGDRTGAAGTLNNLGQVTFNQGDIGAALETYQSALRLYEADSNKNGVARILNNLAFIHYNQGNKEKAIEFNLLSLKIRREIGDEGGIAVSLNNLASIYQKSGDPQKQGTTEEKKKAGYALAMSYFREALRLRQGLNDQKAVAMSMNNIGVIHEAENRPDSAMWYYRKSMEIQETINEKPGLSISLFNIANLFFEKKDLPSAFSYLDRSMKIGEELSYPSIIRDAALLRKKIYTSAGRYKEALENFELYIRMRDSISNESTRKASIRSQLKYEYEKQAAADSVVHAKESEVKSAELSRQAAELKAKKNQQYALYGGLALVMVFAAFMYNRFKVTQKQKGIIEHQKELVEEQKRLVEEKQKEVLDSIYYARRIQMAQIPNDRTILNMLHKANARN